MICILLIEDSPNEVKRFVHDANKIEGATVKVASSVGEALHMLNHDRFDIAFIDPMMRDTIDFDRCLTELSKYETVIWVAQPTAALPKWIQDIANHRNVGTVPLKDSDRILEILQEVLSKKSGGTTSQIKQEQHQAAIRQVKLEMLVESLNDSKKETKQIVDKLSNVINQTTNEIIEVKNNQTVMTNYLSRLQSDSERIGGSVKELTVAVDDLQNKRDPKAELVLEKARLRTQVVIAVVGIGAPLLVFMGIVIPQILPYFFPRPVPTPSQSIKP